MNTEEKTTTGRERQPYGLRQSIAAIKDALSIQDYLEDRGVEVRRNRSVCIVHGGDNPESFSINPEKQVWHCFRCDAGGDLLDLAQAVEGGEAWEAMFSLARRFAVELPQRPPGWTEWQDEKGRRRRMIRDNLAESYQRRYFRAYYSEYLSELEPELRETEATALWNGLRSLSFLCADRRLAA